MCDEARGCFRYSEREFSWSMSVEQRKPCVFDARQTGDNTFVHSTMQHAALMPSVSQNPLYSRNLFEYADENKFRFSWREKETHGAVYERKRPQNPQVSHGLSEI